jgi:hypothetical protein
MTVASVPTPPASSRVAGRIRRLANRTADFFRYRDPTVGTAFLPFLVVASILFVRSPASNYIFDEQEALLANPFVNGKVPWKDILTRDFWGLPHDRSIGSYRPLPNVVWRLFWQASPLLHHPWALHFVNIAIHALNAALVARITLGITRDRTVAWLAGGAFAMSAVLTEAVTGVVGIADVFGALGLLLAVLALEASLPTMGVVTFLATSLGFFSKESTLVALPILAWCALLVSPLHHPKRPLRVARALVALLATAASLVLYTETRRRFFPTEPPTELSAPLASGATWVQRGFRAFLLWFQQPRLPQDPINNPLIHADLKHRISGALGVYAGGLGQILFPWTLSGDYSFAAEPIPNALVSLRSVIGGAFMALPPLAAVVLLFRATREERRGNDALARTLVVVAITCLWVPVAYFPHSNIPVKLPTVRAERFLYLPVAGLSPTLGLVLAWLVRFRPSRAGAPSDETPRRRWTKDHAGIALVALFLGFQGVRARLHAIDYTDDLMFWRSTSRAVPMSAKAHLNYGVMLGARGRLEERLVENRRAMEIAPLWPMAHIYYADTLCRLHRPEEGWPSYRQGMTLAPNDRNLIALAYQCLWDQGALRGKAREDELNVFADNYPGTWLAYLSRDIVLNGQRNNGVDKKYRPRGYDEGPSD